MPKQSILKCIKELHRPMFTTRELSSISGKSLSTTTQALNFLRKQGVIFKLYRGIWAQADTESLRPYDLIPFLLSRHRGYVSFISALHLYGMIEQIPQAVTIASTSHTRVIHTKIAVFYVHRIAPAFFKGFKWYDDSASFLIAELEKALVDCLYLSARKKKQFGYFPELHFPSSFSVKKAREWVKRIPDAKIRASVDKKLNNILRTKIN